MKTATQITAALILTVIMALPVMADNTLEQIKSAINQTSRDSQITAALNALEMPQPQHIQLVADKKIMQLVYGRYGGSFAGLNGTGSYGGAFYGPEK